MNMRKTADEFRTAADRYGLTTVLAAFGNDLKFRVPMTQTLWDTSIDELNLSVRSYNGLRRAGADTIGKVAEIIMSDNGLFRVRNLGKKSIMAIKTSMLLKGYEQLPQHLQTEFWIHFLEHNTAPGELHEAG